MRNSKFSRSANLSRILIDSSLIPTSSMNEHLYYGANVPQNQSSIPIRFSSFLPHSSLSSICPIICSTICPGDREYTQTLSCRWHAVITVWVEDKDERRTERWTKKLRIYWKVWEMCRVEKCTEKTERSVSAEVNLRVIFFSWNIHAMWCIFHVFNMVSMNM